MCFEVIAIISTIASIAGTFATASHQSKVAENQALIANRQLKVDMENEKIAMMQKTGDRMEELRRAEATNIAALSATGLDTNIAYAEAIRPYNQKVAGRDVARTRYNSGQVIGRKKYEINVNNYERDANQGAIRLTALSDAVGTAGTFAAGYRSS